MFETFKGILGVTPNRVRGLVLAPVLLLLAGCNQVGGNQITFWDIVWSISIFFLWLIFIWMFVALFIDVIRRRDIGGWAKAGWIIFMLILPFLGILLYVAMRPAETPDAWSTSATSMAGSGSQVDELARLQQLRASGAITDAEFNQLKANVIA